MGMTRAGLICETGILWSTVVCFTLLFLTLSFIYHMVYHSHILERFFWSYLSFTFIFSVLNSLVLSASLVSWLHFVPLFHFSPLLCQPAELLPSLVDTGLRLLPAGWLSPIYQHQDAPCCCTVPYGTFATVHEPILLVEVAGLGMGFETLFYWIYMLGDGKSRFSFPFCKKHLMKNAAAWRMIWQSQ